MTSEISPQTGRSVSRFVSWRELLLFTLFSVACMAVVFGSVLWNATVLAPLDVPSALFSKYHWLNETQGPVPRNHYLVDCFDKEMPHQYCSYLAIQSGEFPWWDPYIDGGRPLVAEEQFSGADVVRLVLYRFLPFVPAYNLARLIPSFLLGLGAFLLLRYWGHRLWLALAMALAFQFAGAFTLYQYPICFPAALAWYAWIWLLWSCYLRSRQIFWLVMAGLLCALSMAAGNLQTHAYLIVFAACFFLGNAWVDHNSWKPALKAAVLSPLLGALLALPVLAPQVELFLLSDRRPAFAEFSTIQWFTGVASLSGFFPWAMGTFRTIDLSKLFNQTGLGFVIFIGSPALILSTMGAVNVFRRSRRTAQGCIAVLLVAFYFIVCSTPLVAIFYTRTGVLAVLGSIVLAADGLHDLWENVIFRWQKKLALLAVAWVFGVLICCNVFAFFIYPHIQSRVESVVLKREKQNPAFASAPELRQFQVRNLPREISVLNLETVIGAMGVAALLAALCGNNTLWRTRWLTLALVLNVLPELSFAEQFTVKSPVSLWQKLVAGGPEQNRVREALQGGLRLHEVSTNSFDYLFPGADADLYEVYVTGGYTSFHLPDVVALWDNMPGHAPAYDAIYISDKHGQPAGQLEMLPRRATPARFQWETPSQRGARIISESLNTVTVEVDDGEPGVLWRTDRYYPGWNLISPELETRVVDKNFLTVKVPAGRQVLVFQYRPRFLTPALLVSAATLLGCITCLIFALRRRGNNADAAKSSAVV
ncbi:MAG: hypothetical protein WBN22_10080 [Verrucomicrobiia bacterium]